uniref:C-type lectin domain-containing protein n=1 Tax=Neogobius melanostomus TaxID=47308 RepID=A0A8C6SMU3_9GOBI
CIYYIFIMYNTYTMYLFRIWELSLILLSLCVFHSEGSSSWDNCPKQYTYISTSKSWEDARSYCRQHYTDLAMIEDESENTAVAAVLVTNQWAWIGLYRQPWRWSDGSDSTICSLLFFYSICNQFFISALKLVTILQNKGLTDLKVKWKAPPQKIKKNRKSLNLDCLN